MGAAAVPIVAAIIGAGGSVASTAIAAKRQKAAQKEAQKKAFLFSEADREKARQGILQSIFAMSGGTEPMPQQPDQSEEEVNQYVQAVLNRYSRPSAAYHGWLQAEQERRDARAGVAAVPPQGAASPSAQRRMPSVGGRSY